MGNKQSVFTEEELNEYKLVTYLNDNEILECYKKFTKLADSDENESKRLYLSYEQFASSPDFAANPFRDRIFKVFSSKDKGMTFEDYLNMMSVFSDSAPSSIKCRYAFEIYKFDQKSKQDRLTRKDVKHLIDRLVGSENANKIEKQDMTILLDKIFEEADIDNSNDITLDEFEHIVMKSIEFPMNFCIRI